MSQRLSPEQLDSPLRCVLPTPSNYPEYSSNAKFRRHYYANAEHSSHTKYSSSTEHPSIDKLSFTAEHSSTSKYPSSVNHSSNAKHQTSAEHPSNMGHCPTTPKHQSSVRHQGTVPSLNHIPQTGGTPTRPMTNTKRGLATNISQAGEHVNYLSDNILQDKEAWKLGARKCEKRLYDS